LVLIAEAVPEEQEDLDEHKNYGYGGEIPTESAVADQAVLEDGEGEDGSGDSGDAGSAAAMVEETLVYELA